MLAKSLWRIKGRVWLLTVTIFTILSLPTQSGVLSDHLSSLDLSVAVIIVSEHALAVMGT